MIREIEYPELHAASRVLWKSFYEAEKNNYSMEAMEKFRDLVEPVSLSMNSYDGKIRLFGYFRDNDLLAVGAVKEKMHVLMLYVLPIEQNKGIGKELLAFLEGECDSKRITLNSSDCAIPFYSRFGYRVIGERTVSEGFIFTPMEKHF